jgi:CDP-glucose 4,6-dehydratase
LEDVEMNREFWKGKRVLVTGHTGFKGAWLSLWLVSLGADVCGYSLEPVGELNLFKLVGIDGLVQSHIGDINDAPRLNAVMAGFAPDVVLHLAAQALVRPSYDDPVGTFTTNVSGVASVLDAVRRVPSVKAVVVVTSDKCYDNKEWYWGYRETDELGGRDPYSASKGCAEIVARSMQMSFFAPFARNGHPARIATVRAGNVIGGGDWSDHRLVPDIIRGCLGEAGEVHLRNPDAVRPWQHVMDPLAAYLLIAERLVEQVEGADSAWNIGPDAGDNRAVAEVAEALIAGLGVGRIVSDAVPKGPHEARLLALDCAKAKTALGWRPRFDFADCIKLTADWYSAWHRGHDMAEVTRAQIALFEQGTAGSDSSLRRTS